MFVVLTVFGQEIMYPAYPAAHACLLLKGPFSLNTSIYTAFSQVDNYHMRTIFFWIFFSPMPDFHNMMFSVCLKKFELEIKSAFYPLKRSTIESG